MANPPFKLTPDQVEWVMKPLTLAHLESLPYEPAAQAGDVTKWLTPVTGPKPDTATAQADLHTFKIDDLPPAHPGMLEAAEQALHAHRRQVEIRERIWRAMRAFRRAPTAEYFIELWDAWTADRANLASRRELYGFIVETLRPGGLPRDGPFVWCAPDTDAMDTLDTTEGLPKMATKSILTPPGTASFLNLKEPRAVVVGGEPRYSFTLIFDKDAQKRPEFKALQVAIDEALKEKWPHKLPNGLKSPFHDGAEKAGVYEGYKPGDIFISPWSKDKPGAVNKDKQDVIDWSEFYAGWLARANVRPFAYDQGGNKGCGLFLDSVQFLRPGKRLDGRKAANESFPDDDEGDDDEMV